MTHVFVVSEKTFDIHLKYMFAGTGNQSFEPNLDCVENNKYEQERALTDMIADISKVRTGDKVIFYVTGCKKFFGIFEIAGNAIFQPKKTDNLEKSLGRYLPFRVRIKPYKVYAEGITEEIALDDISSIAYPYEMCWSMIYRKLTGLRGCSFLFDYESKKLETLIKNNKNSLLSGKNFCYDAKNHKITKMDNPKPFDDSTAKPLCIDTRLYSLAHGYEGQLQAYILQKYDIDEKLSSKLLPPKFKNKWIGNEVVCSVGERRIDILIIAETDDEIYIRVVELKDKKPNKDIFEKQLKWYINWVKMYVVPNLICLHKKIKIIPTIIAHKYKNKCSSREEFEKSIEQFYKKSKTNNSKFDIIKTECIFYEKSNDALTII